MSTAPTRWLEAPASSSLHDDARTAFTENPRLVLEVAREIGASRGQTPQIEVTRAAQQSCQELELSPVEFRDELGAVLVQRDVDRSLQWLQEVGIVRRFLPELEATKDLKQESGRQHKDVWEHTKLVVKQAVPRPAVRWAALLHDIGKPPTRRYTEKGVHFHGHAEVGARMFDSIIRRIPFERPMQQKIRFLIQHHLRSAQYEPSWTDSAVRRFDRDMEEHLIDLLDLSRADITSKRPGRRQSLLRQISDLRDRIDRLREDAAIVPPLPKGLGTAISERFNIPPSRELGDLKKGLETAVEAGELEPHRDFDYYLEALVRTGKVPK